MSYQCFWWFFERRFVAAAWFFLLMTGLAVLGCGVEDLKKKVVKPPKVNLKAVGLKSPTVQGLPLICVLEVENPNPVTVKVLGYDYEVWMEERSVAQGESNQPFILPAQGEAVVELPVLLKIRALPGLVPQALKEGKLVYIIAGGLRLPQTLGVRVPFRFTGDIAAEQGLNHLRPLFHKYF